MKIDFCSDLHVDYFDSGLSGCNWKKLKNPDSQYLMIAGDVSNHVGQSLEMVRRACEEYDHVFFTDGNHEHYYWDTNVQDCINHIDKAFKEHLPKATYLNGVNFKIIDKVMFYGCNGWYDWRMANDYSPENQYEAWSKVKVNHDREAVDYGPYHNPKDWAEYYAATMEKVIGQATSMDHIDDIIIMTHTCPIYQGIKSYKKYDALSGSFGNSMFKSVLDADIEKKIRFWIYGHTHNPIVHQEDYILFLNNVRGYPVEGLAQNWWLKQLEL